MRFTHILTALGINAVPALGWFLGDWNSGTTLTIYWIETVFASFFVALRAVFHRRVVRVRGHFRYETTGKRHSGGARIPFLRHYLPVMLAFSAAHGVFLTSFVVLLTHKGKGAEMRLDFHAMALGCGIMLAMQTVDFLIDLPGMDRRPFRWIEGMAERSMARVFVIHLTIMIGMLASGLSGGMRGFFVVFVILKTINDLSGTLPQYDPEEAPRWLCRLLDMIPDLSKKKGKGTAFGGTKEKTFAEFWKAGKVDERRRRERNEALFDESW